MARAVKVRGRDILTVSYTGQIGNQEQAHTKSRGRVEVGEGWGSAGVGWRDGKKGHTAVIE